MAEDFKLEKNTQQLQQQVSANSGERKIIDESQYVIRSTQRESGPSAVGRGGDPLFRRIKATKEQLSELLEETQTVQDWLQRETSNNVALSCLDNENLKDVYYEIKDGFDCGETKYGKISLMGFKTPQGVEIPRLKIYDADGEVLEVLTGPMAIDELNKRALAYKNSANSYEAIPENADDDVPLADYVGNSQEEIT